MTPTIPETFTNKDWPRRVKQAVESAVKRIAALEAHTVQTITFTPIAEPASPVEGMTYQDSTTHTLRTFDGTVWRNHW